MNIQPVEVCKFLPRLRWLNLCRCPETNFHKTKPTLRLPFRFRLQYYQYYKRTGRYYCIFSFAITFYREGLPFYTWLFFFTLVILVVAKYCPFFSSVLRYNNGGGFYMFLHGAGFARDLFRLSGNYPVWLLCVECKIIYGAGTVQQHFKTHRIGAYLFSTFGIDDYKFKSPEHAKYKRMEPNWALQRRKRKWKL